MSLATHLCSSKLITEIYSLFPGCRPYQDEENEGSAADLLLSQEGGRFGPKARRITQVVMVGGATAMPQVQDFVGAVTGIQPQARPSPSCNPSRCGPGLHHLTQHRVLADTVSRSAFLDQWEAVHVWNEADGCVCLPGHC